MNSPHNRRVAALLAATVAGTGLALIAPGAAQAEDGHDGRDGWHHHHGSTRIGPVRNLAAEATKPGAEYVVDAHWSTLSGATKYVVSLTDAQGTKLTGATVKTAAFHATTNLTVGAKAFVKVTPYVRKRAGRSTSVSVTMPDLTAPTASYTVLPHNAAQVTVQRDSLSDDLTAQSSITQKVAWGDGSTSSWPTGNTTISHTYPSTKQVYYPVVTVADQAHNSADFTLTAVVGDTTKPSGAYSAVQANAFAKYTWVHLTDVGVADDLSTPENVTRVVTWGDDTAPQIWAAGTAPRHRYASAGTYSPTVTLTDQAGNDLSDVPAGTVEVVADTLAPATAVSTPAAKLRVAAWKRLCGISDDGAGVGVNVVKVRLVEKRHGHWYSYKPATHSWVKSATKAKALKRAGVAKVRTDAAHKWNLRVFGLRAGRLVVQASGADRVGNVSTWAVRTQKVTR